MLGRVAAIPAGGVSERGATLGGTGVPPIGVCFLDDGGGGTVAGRLDVTPSTCGGTARGIALGRCRLSLAPLAVVPCLGAAVSGFDLVGVGALGCVDARGAT